jgi:hypothetical protein
MLTKTTSVYDLIRAAVINKWQVSCWYNDHFRILCPHAIGHSNGVERVLGFQFGGTSSRGLPSGGEWRCMDIPGMTDVTTQPGTWHTGTSHSRPQTCVKILDIDITES